MAAVIRATKAAGRAHHFVSVGIWAAVTGRVIDQKAYDRWLQFSRFVREGIVECWTEQRLEWLRGACEAMGRGA